MSIYYVIWASSPSTNQDKHPEKPRSLITEDEARAEVASFIEKLKTDTGVTDWQPHWRTEEVPHEFR